MTQEVNEVHQTRRAISLPYNFKKVMAGSQLTKTIYHKLGLPSPLPFQMRHRIISPLHSFNLHPHGTGHMVHNQHSGTKYTSHKLNHIQFHTQTNTYSL